MANYTFKRRLSSRTWWSVFLLSQEAFYLALRHNWDPVSLAVVWGILLGVWTGNKHLPKYIDAKFPGNGSED